MLRFCPSFPNSHGLSDPIQHIITENGYDYINMRELIEITDTADSFDCSAIIAVSTVK